MAWLLLLLAPEFVNVAEEAGLAGVASGRAVFVDLDADDRLDVVLNRRSFFLQRGGKFRPAPPLPVVPDLVLFADFDNDGDADCFAGFFCEPQNPNWKDKGQVNSIFWNRGDATWRRQPLAIPRTSVHAACTFDYDKDGVLDLAVGSGYVVYGESLESHPDRLYRGPDFSDVTEQAGLLTVREPGRRESSKPTYGLTHGDLDGDGWQDLWVATYGRQWNFLWRNREGAFTDVAAATRFDGDADRSGKYPEWLKPLWKKRFGHERPDEPPFRANGNTFDCAIADYDNDGDMDCILAEITHEWAGPSSDLTSLLVQEQGKFTRRPEAFTRARTAVGRWNQGDIHCGWLDYDNDGLLDALIASSDYPDRQELKLYRQTADHTFEPPRTFDWEGAGQISVGDYDNDGDLDILVGRSLNRLPKERRERLGKSCALFRNDVGNANRWLQVVCRGEKGVNRDGIGCRIRVTTADGVTQTREIRGGLGHAGHNGPYIAHFGLGGHERARTVEVRFPDRGNSTKTLRDVAAGQRLVVTR